MKDKKRNYSEDQKCPECGTKINERIELFISECDRCLAKKAE